MSGHGWQLVVDWRALDGAQRELLIGALWCHSISGIEERDDDVVVGFENESDARAAAAELSAPSTILEVLDDAYLDKWRQFARPWSVGRLFVRPSWVEASPPPGAIEIVIDPQRAFGSGAHASTRLALSLLQELDLGASAVLDLGCGSGVLSVAAAALGAPRIEAIDVEIGAVEATIDNARRNGVGEKIRARVATIDDVTDEFDVVVANVLPSVHREVAEGVRRVARRFVIVAGMLDAQAVEVESWYRAARVGSQHEDGWCALVLRVDRVDLGS
ncbi:MAG: 50S ribosomal protein L11 methyltransferase [Acidimicrobiales bacterium]